MKIRFGQKVGLFVWVMVLVSVLWGVRALAALPGGGSDIPESLRPWRAWVLHGQEAWLCPEVAGGRDRAFCAWPGELKLEVARQGGGMRFSQSWELQHESAVPLPGNRKYLPQQVTVNGRAHPVLVRNGAPVVWLQEGRYAISGWVPWLERPQAVDIPENVALVSLVVDGNPVLPLERHGKALTLGMREDAGETDGREGDSLDVQVVRKLTDGIPARLTTRLLLKVSGKAREWSVPDILPAHFVPVRITSPWAARLDTDGRLQVQVMPGQAMVEIEARLDKPLESIEPGFSPERPQEVWSYEAAPGLRVTAVSSSDNMLAVDPRQAGVPMEWLSLPAFVLNPGARFQVEERSRGQNEREGQRLTLKRDMWLDFSGKAFFARDRIEGTMRQGWRFDVALPYRLERADSLGSHADASDDLSAALLVTHGADESLTGVEWHQANVSLNAGVQLAAGTSSRVPATGWQQPFDSVETTLRVPYGYRLIAAPGADRVSDNAWVERWTVLDVFLAAFVSLLAWRLFGRAGGVAAVVYLMLAMQMPFAPIQLFAAVIILALLRRAMPEGHMGKALRVGERIALVCFIGVALVFIPVQLRTAFYPQLEEEGGASPVLQSSAPQPEASSVVVKRRAAAPNEREVEMDMAAASPEIYQDASPLLMATPAPAPAEPSSLVGADGSLSKPAQGTSGSISKYASAPERRQRYAQSTVTQTGGGEPAWELGHRYQLSWFGPVSETQSVRLLISPPWLTGLLHLLVIALLGWFIWRLIFEVFPCLSASSSCTLSPWKQPRTDSPSRASAALFVLCLAGFVAAGLGVSVPAAAAPGGVFPSDELLKELRVRLLETPACAPVCADVARVRIDAGESQLKAELVAHIETTGSLALPEPDEHMTLRGARVNGEARPVLRVRGKNYVALPRGIHYVQLEYAISGDAASLSFPMRPAQIEFGSAHWQVEGIDEDRLLGETLNFFRVSNAALSVDREGAAAASSAPTQQFLPFVHVQRDLVFGLDWNVHTQVSRIAPGEGGFTFQVPLLRGEHITTPEVKVQDGRASAVFSTKAVSAFWTARLDKTESLELLAPPLTDHAEVWRITVNPSWHLEWNGVPVVLSSAGEDVVFEFHPLPGERLTLTLKQPAKVEGGTRAIDRVRLENRVGRHASDVTLEFSLRASQGGDHLITLPQELEVLEVRRNGASLNLQPRENRLSLPVSPGAQTYTLKLRNQEDIGFFTSSPGIDLGLLAANINLRTVLGEDRWILYVSGPAAGPAVLYWGELLVVLLLAFLLARSSVSSLKCWQWFLLVLGFSTFSWMALFTIALWLIVIDWRVRCESCQSWSARKFNAMQVSIVILTVVMLEGLIGNVLMGLSGVPDMGISGYGSSGSNLAWFADKSDSLLPAVKVFSLPIWLYRVFMLAWTIWFATVFIRWSSRGLSAWLKGGYWKKDVPPPAASEAVVEGEKHEQERRGGK